jgi:hypothetical protein
VYGFLESQHLFVDADTSHMHVTLFVHVIAISKLFFWGVVLAKWQQRDGTYVYEEGRNLGVDKQDREADLHTRYGGLAIAHQ